MVLNSANDESATSKESFVGDKVKLDSGNLEFRDILSGYRHQVYGNGSLIIQEVDKSDESYFMCQISNGVGAGLSRVMFLKVNGEFWIEFGLSSIEFNGLDWNSNRCCNFDSWKPAFDGAVMIQRIFVHCEVDTVEPKVFTPFLFHFSTA